ncbi:MAG: hypothetical protein FH748_01625 [Balneolaceae bacterium]|nr:hypothetical protein [Balneolaceae bacterium]
MSLFYIAVSIICSLSVAQFLKIAETKKIGVFKILAVNYLTAFFISYASSSEKYDIVDSMAALDGWVYILAGVLGIIFIANLAVYSRSIDRIGMGISIAAMRMSLIFPIALSLWVFNESLVWIRYVGIVTAFIALLLMLPRFTKKKITGISDAWLPLLIFIMTGFADSGLKIYESVYSAEISEGLFLSGLFLVSFIFGMGVLIYRRDLKFSAIEIGYGVATGIVNLYSSIFLIYALQSMPGSVVFPIINVCLVILGTFVGIWFWNDQPTKKQWFGLLVAIISILLLVG